MIPSRSQLLAGCFFLSDLLVTATAWLGAYFLRFDSGWLPLYKPAVDFHLCWRTLPLVLLLCSVAYRLAGQYQVHRLRRFREEVVAVLKGTSLLTLLVLATLFLLHDPYESRGTLFLFAVLTVTGILLGRRVAWSLVRYLRSHGFNQNFAVIVGTGRVARKTARALRHASWMGIKNVGFVEERSDRWTSDLDVLGRFGDLPAIIDKYRVRHVFIALPLSRYDDARRVFDVLSQSLVEVRLVADVPNLAGLSMTTTNLDGLPVLGLRESPHFGLNVVVKRAMDIVLSLAALFLLSPVFLVIAAAIKLTSRGPVFFWQERCGLNGKTFHMLKFRSMRTDAEIQSGAVWAAKDDPRRTWLGTFLRRTSLDELPQLINVLKGDMSLVGPRPERPVFIQKFARTIPSYMARHRVKAGITGWAQVNGWRGNTSLRKRIQYDLYYITHWTPWLDLRILWLTVFRGFVHKNAY
ncbi:MAG: undecaprenyl-phosphate glucose phosphotransferase [Planctomycetes bacterium]|nr:undecaprenyl-phosphate glucose phosphotransferase [Planctomycetota bacterium]